VKSPQLGIRWPARLIRPSLLSVGQWRPRGNLAVSYTKDVGEVSARYRPGDQAPSVTYPSGTHVVFTAPGSAPESVTGTPR
jgi:hypothetical protein